MARESNPILFGPDQKPWRETLSTFARSATGELLVAPPSDDLMQCYAKQRVEGITTSWYQVPSTGLTLEQQSQAQLETRQLLQYYTSNMLGFQCNLDLGYTAAATPYTSFHLNNHGDPFVQYHDFDTKWMERSVLDYYASLWHAKWPHNPNDPATYWGYVLTMGATEGNLMALYMAREYLSGVIPATKPMAMGESSQRYLQADCPKDNSNAFTPLAFYSHESHNSMQKALRLLKIPTFSELGTQKYPGENPLGGPWPVAVPCTGGDAGPGTIDIDALTKLVDFFTAKGHPIIVIFNYGTTLKGTYDDVKAAGEALIPILKKNNMHARKVVYDPKQPEQHSVCQGFWFHVDGALGASYMPFVRMAREHGLINEEPGPAFDFQLDFVSSIVTSGHKWTGAPYPCGILLLRSGLRALPLTEPEFSGLVETTLAGSRNGLSALLLWMYISTHSYDTQVKMAVHCVELAQYAVKKLKELENEMNQDLWVSRSPASLAVLFRKPCTEVCRKYCLPFLVLKVGGQERLVVHIYLMPSVTTEKIDELISDLRKPGTFE